MRDVTKAADIYLRNKYALNAPVPIGSGENKMSTTFEDYVSSVKTDTLYKILEDVTHWADDIILREINLRRVGKNIGSQPVDVWLEVRDKEFEYQQVDFKEARKMALYKQLKCQFCYHYIYNISEYIRNRGYCNVCQGKCKAQGDNNNETTN